MPENSSARFWSLLVAIGLILIAAFSRLLPHPANFSPISAMALFGGAVFARRSMAIVIPLVAMLLSDLVLGFHSTLPFVYLAIALTGVIGTALASRRSVASVGAASVASAVLFFIITNFGVWVSGELYPRTTAGLAECFTLAIPFFQNTLISTVVFTAAFFGVWNLAGFLVGFFRPMFQRVKP